jgi:hypothetical protein
MLWKHVNGPATFLVQQAVANVNGRLYGGNLTVDARALPASRKGNSCRFTLRVKDTHLPPARKSSTGRHTNAVNWMAHAEVMAALFEAEPDSILVTALTTYTGKADFDRRHRDTYSHNAGSKVAPVAFGDL